MADRSELGILIGITDARGNLVRVGSPIMPVATSPVRLRDGIPYIGDARAILTSSHLTIFDGLNVSKREQKRISTVPPGTIVWRSPSKDNKRV